MICSAIVRRFDYSWLAEIQKDLALAMEPKPQRHMRRSFGDI